MIRYGRGRPDVCQYGDASQDVWRGSSARERRRGLVALRPTSGDEVRPGVLENERVRLQWRRDADVDGLAFLSDRQSGAKQS